MRRSLIAWLLAPTVVGSAAAGAPLTLSSDCGVVALVTRVIDG